MSMHRTEPPTAEKNDTATGPGPTRTATRGAFAALAALAIATGSAAASPPFVPTPLEIPQTPSCNQRDPEVVTLADGDLMAAWVGDVGEELGIAGRRLRPDGVPTGDELALEVPDTVVSIGNVELAPLPDGGFLVGWSIREESGGPVRILLSRFDADGVSLGTTDAAVNGDAALDRFALAVDGEGRAAVAWTDDSIVWLNLFDADQSPLTGARPVGQTEHADSIVGTVAVARTDAGWNLVVWEESDEADEDVHYDLVRARAVDPDGIAPDPAFTVNDRAARGHRHDSLDPTVSAVSEHVFVVAWTTELAVGVDSGVYARELTDIGFPLGPSFQVNSDQNLRAQTPTVVATEEGGYALAWQIQPPSPPITPLPPGLDLDPVLHTRWFGAGGVPAGDEFELWNRNDHRIQSTPALAYSQGFLVQVWRDHFGVPPILPPACVEDPRIVSMSTRLTCVPTETRLCLQRGRFAVETLLPSPIAAPSPGLAPAEPLTDDTGTFWFFRPENVELMTKVIDGRAVNGRFWFFSGALSDVGYTIRVTDTVTGTQKDYPSGGELVSFSDTRTFFDPPPPPAAAEGSAPATARLVEPREAPPSAVAPAVASAAEGGSLPACDIGLVLCLHDGALRASLEWIDPRTGAPRLGIAVPLTDESGYFWFFHRDNAEVVLKILDGRPVNGRFWAFVGGMTDVELTLTVDSSLFPPNQWVYEKPFGVVESIADTRGILSCPNCSTSPDGPAAAEGAP